MKNELSKKKLIDLTQGDLDELINKYEALEDVLLDMVNQFILIHESDFSTGRENYKCQYCEEISFEGSSEEDQHEPDCPYLKAKNLLNQS